MPPTREQAAAGQFVYTPRMLRLYDAVVLGISNRFIWKCPLLQLYNDHVSNNHLDVGVGTGYYLDHCRFPSDHPRITLLDMNPHCLRMTSARIARYSPTCHETNVLELLQLDERFDSIGLNYVLHCLPGAMHEKLVAVKHLSELLTPGGVLFGSTLLHGGVSRGWPARCLMQFYNRKRIFSNAQDDLATLERGFAEVFDSYDLSIVGCAALLCSFKEV